MNQAGKGQAALEFITTYGWAILVLLVMISALAYFGILNPTKYLPDRCVFSTGINCKDFQALNAGFSDLRLLLTIENKEGQPISIQVINVTSSNKNINYFTSICATPAAFPTASIPVDAGFQFDCTITGLGSTPLPGSSPGVGQPVKFNVIISYTTLRGSYPHIANGIIQTTVQ